MALFAVAMDIDCEFRGGEPGVSFEDDATYYVLESYLSDSEIQVDQYDGATFVGENIRSLILRLKSALDDMQLQPNEWVVRTDRWEQGGKSYSIEYRAFKAKVCSVATELMQLAEAADVAGEKIVFVGD